MKKKTKVFISICVAVLIIAGSIVYSVLPHALNYDIKSIEEIGTSVQIVSEDIDQVTIKKADSKDFKVLMFSDMHLDGKNKTSIIAVTNFVNAIKREKPDLVILGGDNVTSALNNKRCHQLAQIFENLGIYWAAVLGNHEGDNPLSISREKMIDIFSSYDHCLIKKGDEEIDGYGNFALNILNSDNSLKETFFLMDTGNRMSDEQKEAQGIDLNENPYDGLKPSQISWYSNKVSQIKNEYGNFKSVVVIHIPLPQYDIVADKVDFLYGAKLEGVCSSGFESGMFDAIKEAKSTQAVFCGHDHVNNFGGVYDCITLSYIESSGYGSYTAESKFGYEEKDWLQGYTILDIEEDGSYSHSQVRYSQISE